MKAIDGGGNEVETRSPRGHEVGVLRGLDTKTLRAFLLSVLKQGGVPLAEQARVFRASKATIARDARAIGPGP